MTEPFYPKIVAIIPARYASVRFPGKMLVDVKGKTLIQRTFESTALCPLLQEIIIATDDQRIYDNVQSFGGKVMMTPPDCATGTDRLAFVLEQHPSLQKAEIIVNIQGDEPCVHPEAIVQLVEILQKDPSAVMSTVVVPFDSEAEALNPSNPKCVLDLQGNALYFSGALIPSGVNLKYREGVNYYKHLGIYAYRPHFLLKYKELPMTPLQKAEDLEQLKALEHGYKIKVAVVDTNSPGVNTPQDLIKVLEYF